MAKLLHKSSVENRIRTHFNNVTRLVESYIREHFHGGVATLQEEAFLTKLLEPQAPLQDARGLVNASQIAACYQLVIEQYGSIIQAYQDVKMQIQSPEIRYILDGICQVLGSQIRFYEENLKSFTMPETICNDQKTIDYYQRQITVFSNEFDNYMKSHGCELMYLEEASCIKTCIEGYVKSSSDFLYRLYQHLFTMKRQEQSQLDRKQTLDGCYKQLHNERETISDLITIQIKALEDVLEKDGAGDKNAVQDVLKLIREIHQHLGRRIKEFSSVFQSPLEEMKSTEEVLVLFAQPFQEIPGIPEEVLKQVKDFKLFFFQILFEILKQVSGLNRMRYELRRNLNEVLSLCAELQNIFRKVTAMPGQDQEIIKGIQETIEIKDESIQENKLVYEKEVLQVIQDIGVILDNDTAFEIFRQWLQEEDKQIELRAFLTENDIWKQILQKQQGANKAAGEKVERKTSHFLKDQILFEISTFEEIMNYSVPRLKEMDDENVRFYVKGIEKADRDIEFTLKKYNICKIKPNAFEFFDGKEQEVLLAEKKEGYEKGQIVKVINSGYKYNGAVIMRANVVAAK